MLLTENNIRFYKGRSMAGTFEFGDHVIVESVSSADVRPGDVVAYRGVNHRSSEDELVHRVMCIRPNGLVVRGDDNSSDDIIIVTDDNLLGRVSHVVRNGKKFPLQGRQFNLLRARVLHGLRHMRDVVWRMIRGMGRRSYGWLRNSGMIAHVWRPQIVRVQLMTENGPLVKYVCRNRAVAFHWLDDGRFKCLKPYDLLLWHEKLKNTGNIPNLGNPS